MPSRTPKDLARALKRGEFERAYYLYGPEEVRKEDALRFLVDQVVDPATRDFNYDLRSAGQLDPDSVEALCNTVPMMAERRLVVIRDVEQWKRKTKARSAFIAYLEKPAPDTVVVLVQGASEPAEDKELARLTTSVAFEVPSADEAKGWLEKRAAEMGITFQPGAIEHLLKCTESNLGALRLELEKFSSLGGAEPISVEQVGDLVGIRQGETIFDWRDAVMQGDAARSVLLLERVLAQPGTSGVRLIMLLGTTLVGLGAVRAAHDARGRGARLESVAFDTLKAGRPFGLLPWKEEAARWARWAPKWSAARLRAATRAALATDTALKSTTLSDERGLLADLMMRLALEETVEA